MLPVNQALEHCFAETDPYFIIAKLSDKINIYTA